MIRYYGSIIRKSIFFFQKKNYILSELQTTNLYLNTIKSRIQFTLNENFCFVVKPLLNYQEKVKSELKALFNLFFNNFCF